MPNQLCPSTFLLHQIRLVRNQNRVTKVKAILYAKENGGSIVSSEYQELNDVKRTLATEELVNLVTKGLLEKKGSIGRSSKYYIRTVSNYH